MPDAIKVFKPDWYDRKSVTRKPDAQRDPKRRAMGRRIYSSENWQRLRLLHLSGSPLCVSCGDPGRHVDHIKPISMGGEPYDQANLQTLCHSCHSRKTVEEFGFAPSKAK